MNYRIRVILNTSYLLLNNFYKIKNFDFKQKSIQAIQTIINKNINSDDIFLQKKAKALQKKLEYLKERIFFYNKNIFGELFNLNF